MNPYQRIIRDKEIQKGHIDTYAKFEQLIVGIELKEKRVLDIGCNLGEMCKILKERGAIPTGIDKERDYIIDARILNPTIKFYVKDIMNIYSNFDIAILSGTLHYLTDYDEFLKKMSIILNEALLLDVWLFEENVKPAFYLSHRNSFIPNKLAFEALAKKYFKVVEEKGKALAPDNSNRVVYHLKNPIKKESKALLIYGGGNTGKSTFAGEMINYQDFHLDDIFIWWLTAHKTMKSGEMSIVLFVKKAMASEKLKKEYLEFHYNWLCKRLITKKGYDILIEGYDMVNKEYRNMIKKCLNELGWHTIEEKELTKIYPN